MAVANRGCAGHDEWRAVEIARRIQTNGYEGHMIPSEAVRHALLDLVASILVHVRVFTAGGCRGHSLSAEHCCQLYRLADMSHNIPAIVDGTYILGFDEEWLLSELSAFDRDYGSQFAQEYREALRNSR